MFSFEFLAPFQMLEPYAVVFACIRTEYLAYEFTLQTFRHNFHDSFFFITNPISVALASLIFDLLVFSS